MKINVENFNASFSNKPILKNINNQDKLKEFTDAKNYKKKVNEKLPDVHLRISGNFSLQSRLVCGVGKKWGGNFVS